MITANIITIFGAPFINSSASANTSNSLEALLKKEDEDK
jgi:hypothetical protein